MNTDEQKMRDALVEAGHPAATVNTIIELIALAKTLHLVPGSKSPRTIAAVDALHSLLRDPKKPLPKIGDEGWAPVRRGFLVVGDTIRVKKEAFDGHKGKTFNGRVGRVAAIRNGQIYMHSTDGKEPHIDGEAFKVEDLERRE